MSVETDVANAYKMQDPLLRLQALQAASHRVDELRSEVARLKGLAAAECAGQGVTQRHMADVTRVTPMMVQQWVKRGRDELALGHPF